MKTVDKNKIVVINQAVNYLTVGICNEFAKEFEDVSLISGSVHEQGEVLNSKIKITTISKWRETHGFKKFMSYIWATLQIYWLLLTKFRKYDVFYISLPPMGYLLNILVPNRFSMLIWDVYPDVFKITGMSSKHLIYRIWSFLNKVSFKKAYRIFTIGDKMADLISQYVDKDRIIVSEIWSIFQENNKVKKGENPFVKKHHLEDKFIVQYSGNIGLTHNVEVLIDIAKLMTSHPSILFQIIGRGPRKNVLEQRVKEEKIANCHFLPFQSDDLFPFSLSASDLGVVILDEKTSKGSVPSKAYNLMSYGIPALYIASPDSELHNYTNKYEHAQCFSKGQLDEIVSFILALNEDKKLYKELSLKSEAASHFFRRENATKFVHHYLHSCNS